MLGLGLARRGATLRAIPRAMRELFIEKRSIKALPTLSSMSSTLSLRRSSSTSTPSSPHTPPLPIRTALVGTATALCTPLFPIIGLNQLLFRFLDPATRTVITGGTSMLYFSAMVLAPNSFYYAPILLPFAIGNGVTAAGVYAALDGLVGGPKVLAAKVRTSSRRERRQ